LSKISSLHLLLVGLKSQFNLKVQPNANEVSRWEKQARKTSSALKGRKQRAWHRPFRAWTNR
jgi:hypothetical protein